MTPGKALRRLLPVALFSAAAAFSFAFSTLGENGGVHQASHRQSERFSSIALTTQHGEPVRFYDDLVRGRTVIVNLMYTSCGESCPADMAALAKLNELLGPRMGRDILMLSLSIDPVGDTPERLKAYWQTFGAKPGWLFLTGKPAAVDQLRRELGAYDLDPAIDADPRQHAGFITVGNDRSDRWTALPLHMHTRQLVGTILRIARGG